MKILALALLLPVTALAQTLGSTSGSQSTAGAAINSAPIQQITFNSPVQPKNVPTIFAPSFSPSTPCSSVISAGVSVAGFGAAIGANHIDKECNHREMVRLLALIGQPDAALALVCIDADVSRTSPQLCARSNFVATRPVNEVTSEKPVMPPAPVQPNRAIPPEQPPIKVGAIGYSPDNKKFVFDGQSWQPASPEPVTPFSTITKGATQ